MPTGLKHLVRCRCVLQQFKHVQSPPQHQFVVFSIINDDDSCVPKLVQCNNCGIIHKVTEISKSQILHGKELLSSLVKIDDIKHSLPQQLVTLLESSDCDLPTWEHAKFIIDNERWGDYVILSKDTESGLKQVKYVRILGKTIYKVDLHSSEESFL